MRHIPSPEFYLGKFIEYSSIFWQFRKKLQKVFKITPVDGTVYSEPATSSLAFLFALTFLIEIRES